jgi:nitrate/nitrite transporter NarK
MFAVGIQVQQYYVCLVGRFIFGLGGESLTVAQNNFTARWFDGPQLALAFGLVLSFARIGTRFSSALHRSASSAPSLTPSMLCVCVCVALCVVCVVLCVVVNGCRLVGELCRHALPGQGQRALRRVVRRWHLSHLVLRYRRLLSGPR